MAVRKVALLILSAGIAASSMAQKKADKEMIRELRTDIGYLASDELEGRRTGTRGESIAADYIIRRYNEMGIKPYKGEYLYPFHFVYGKEISPVTQLRIGGRLLKVSEEAFPLSFSPNKYVASDIIPEVNEQGGIWLVPVYKDADQAADAHFEVEKHLHEQARELIKKGATGIIFYDNFGTKWPPSFSKESIYETVEVPVIYLSHAAHQKYVAGSAAKGGIPVVLDVTISKTERSGNNIAAYIDNGAPYTVIIGAHYDHLGYGEDGNSLHANASKEHQVHHGADDNASGTAAVLQVAKWVSSNHKKARHYNYLFLNFSGEELGLYGSKAFVKEQHIDSGRFAYMINMDMVGRLNDSTHSLEVGGVGTSPSWAEVPTLANNEFRLTFDSSGQGPSDHTSFYNAGLPVLFMFTLQHKDYHKPTDKADLINYPGEAQVIKYVTRIIAAEDAKNQKPRYIVTKQKSVGKTPFKVTLGIMPDYSFQEGGVRVDGVSENRPAAKAGIVQGDIITRLGDIKINGMQSYMEALGKFKPGESTQVTVIRGGKEISMPIEFISK